LPKNKCEIFLPTNQEKGVYASLAETMGKPEAPLRQRLSRLRQRYGQLLREHVLGTISDERISMTNSGM
jgi:DNA-directed RNA polymerase specialized sigma24 family protein